MPRIEPLAMHDIVDEELLPPVRGVGARSSGTSTSTRTYGKNPTVVKALAAFRGALAQARARSIRCLRELVRLKIAGLNACRY